jgi:hypothetical protein
MVIELLFGTWRTSKIHWHGDQITHYGDSDQWRQYVFGPGGSLEIFVNFKGTLHPTFGAINWRTEKEQIIITEKNTWHSRILTLTDDLLIIKSDETRITYYLKKI